MYIYPRIFLCSKVKKSIFGKLAVKLVYRTNIFPGFTSHFLIDRFQESKPGSNGKTRYIYSLYYILIYFILHTYILYTTEVLGTFPKCFEVKRLYLVNLNIG